MKVHAHDGGLMTRINKALDPATAQGEYIGLTLIEPEAADAAGRRARGHLASATRSSTTRTASRSTRTAAGTSASRRSAQVDWVEVDDHARSRPGAGGRLPLLTRMIGTPLAVDIGPGAVAQLAPLLADRRISRGRARGRGRRARAGRGDRRARCGPSSRTPSSATLEDGGVDEAHALAKRLRAGSFDALVGIGGGRTLDVAKYAATLSGLPMVAVATTLAHDGIASPVASLEEDGRKGSFGVQMPIALVVDLDYVRRSEPAMRRSGIGDVDLEPVGDRRLAARRARARRARRRPRGHVRAHGRRRDRCTATDGIDDDDFLIALAEALVLSGLAMATAGRSRPCSGGDHEILHAIDQLFPGTARHGELAGAARLFTRCLRGDAAHGRR